MILVSILLTINEPLVFLQMKIQGQNKQMLAAACQMFMGKSEAEIAQIALETLEGHQRAIIAHLTVEVRAPAGVNESSCSHQTLSWLLTSHLRCFDPTMTLGPPLTGDLQGSKEVLRAGV